MNIKNKLVNAPIFKKAEFDIMYNEGVSKEGSLMDIAIDEEFVVEKK